MDADTLPVANYSGWNAVFLDNGSWVETTYSERLPNLPANGTGSASYGPLAPCGFDGVIVVAGPLSFQGGFYANCLNLKQSLEMFVDWLLIERNPPGVSLGGKRYAMRVHWVDDQSSPVWAPVAMAHAVRINNADFTFGGFASSLTKRSAIQASLEGKLTLSAAASSIGVFEKQNLTFGMLPPAPYYIHAAIVAIAAACVSAELPCKIAMIEQSTIENSNGIPNSFGVDTCTGCRLGVCA